MAAANYGGPVKLYETQPGSPTTLRDVSVQHGLVGTTGGRAIVAGHIVSSGGSMDIFFNNENGVCRALGHPSSLGYSGTTAIVPV